MLPDTEQIATALLEKIEPINTEGDFDDLILRRRKDRPSATETAYLQAFPKEFSEFVARFDLDHFSIGNIDFGRGSYFDFLVETNKVDEFGMGWWGKGDRPAHLHQVYLASSPSVWWNQGHIHQLRDARLAKGQPPLPDVALHISIGEYEQTPSPLIADSPRAQMMRQRGQVDHTRRYAQAMQKQLPQQRVQFAHYPAATHATAALHAIIDGLRFASAIWGKSPARVNRSAQTIDKITNQ